ncbi:hypothetical protein CPT_Shaeky_024 [Streptomyces phage Shaeky]|uniref:Uncharacterized protein n=1 Tax=Streptomyces phage Shaeky TaxID=2767586 RepID=A0A873WPW7_9CAUD|nr:hypothetical protein CPT_Shaeky_024 [Streptomyces phage Shaeky]
MVTEGPEIIGREILRLDAEVQRDGDRMGKARRKEVATRREALVWALHAALTGDRTKTPGTEVETFLGALRASDGPA